MKTMTILSLVTATMLFTACGEKTKEQATDAANQAVESTKSAVTKAVDATKDAASEATQKAQDVVDKTVDSAKETADDVAKSVKETTNNVVDSVKETTTNVVASAQGALLYKNCAGCHGADGKTIALGKSPVLAGQSKEELLTKLQGYKAGTINVHGMGTLMKGQMASVSDADMDALAAYMSTF